MQHAFALSNCRYDTTKDLLLWENGYLVAIFILLRMVGKLSAFYLICTVFSSFFNRSALLTYLVCTGARKKYLLCFCTYHHIVTIIVLVSSQIVSFFSLITSQSRAAFKVTFCINMPKLTHSVSEPHFTTGSWNTSDSSADITSNSSKFSWPLCQVIFNVAVSKSIMRLQSCAELCAIWHNT